MKSAVFFDALARATLAEVAEREAQDILLDQLDELVQAFTQSDIRSLLTADRLDKTLSGLEAHVSKQGINILRLLIARGLLGALPEFVARVKALREKQGTCRQATVTSATPLSGADIVSLREQLEQAWGMPARLTTVIDPAVVGGVRIDAGSWRYDATLQGALQRFSHSLTA